MACVLDYPNAYFHIKESNRNKLYIKVDSRVTLTNPAEEYLLLAPHPREETFKDDGNVYGPKLLDAQGASDIIFMVDQPNNKATVVRRCDTPNAWPEGTKFSVGESPYTGSLHNPPATIQGNELFSYADICEAADCNKTMVATVEFSKYGRAIRIEFPVRVLNKNPVENAPVGKQWQAASPMVPVFIESGIPGNRIRPGHIAFGRLGEAVQTSFVYIVNTSSPRPSWDFSATLTQVATVRLFAI